MTGSIEEEAIRWRDRLAADPSSATRSAFERWRSADPRHAHAVIQQERLLKFAYGTKLRAEQPERRRRRLVSPQLAAFGGAAAAAAALVLWTHSREIVPGQQSTNPRLTLLLLTRPERLADGSLVVLGPGARIRAEPRDARRQVRLSGGSARFIVAPDPEPFVALAGTVSVVARQTVFDIDLTSGRPRVTVLAGDAVVSGHEVPSSASPIELAPGQALDPGATVPRFAASETGPRLGPLEVDDMAVADVLAIAERGAGTRVALADPAIGARRVTGRFDVGDARALSRKLAAALDLAVDEQGGVVTLRRR